MKLKRGRVDSGKKKVRDAPLSESMRPDVKRQIMAYLESDDVSVDVLGEQRKIVALGEDAVPILRQIRDSTSQPSTRRDVDEILELIELDQLAKMAEENPKAVVERAVAVYMDLSKEPSFPERYLEILGQMGPHAVRELIEIIESKDPITDDCALVLLSELATSHLKGNSCLLEAVPALERLVRDTPSESRVYVISHSEVLSEICEQFPENAEIKAAIDVLRK